MSVAHAVPLPSGPPTLADFQDPAVHRDPYPFYARLRRERPVLPLALGPRGPNCLVSRYDDVLFVLRDERFGSDRRSAGQEPGWIERKLMMDLNSTMVMRDGADHRRLRNLAHQAFTTARVEALAARVEGLVQGMLDRMERAGKTDLIADLALPLPITVICDLMGVPERDRPTFQRWMSGLVDVDSGAASLVRTVPKMIGLFRFIRRLIETRRKDRGDDLLSALIAAEEDGSRLSSKELVSSTFLLLLAGHETTVNLIGNGMLALVEHPEQMERLRADPSLIDSAVEELLRFTSPVQMPAPRFVIQDVEVGGVLLRRGQAAAPLIGSANRDEAHFPDPGRLDLGRSPNRHLAFGFGVHYCVGAPLARLEARAVFRALSQRFPRAALAVPRENLRWRKSRALRGLDALPLRLR